ncbi:ribose-5-phosphate isomerase RpiA [Aurantimonas sp. VKM B-3413]|uniref:ribose-5-phosphate isomerase RpiA n=1 Tax=Aurantimonas sp. VKM B-3413 TaxID=2779401 RepID=UPI001E3677FB|nr:ribose-5-phosphate isomerase RpiA [Aurantimonas sp. VKM B-3413]MCB8837497.1 ribose-5-phosphate isomerase RpiA [Aurantimonas sp. VKM B-3413]
MADAAALKRMAGEAAAARVEEGMRLGIGTGSTAEAFVHALAERVRGGLKVMGVTTSERTEALCRELKVPTTSLEALPHLDLTVDGADEVDSQLRLIKGGGGALLREKIVAAASDRLLVIVDESKKVEVLGAFPLPIEINGFGMVATYLAIREVAAGIGLEGDIILRRNGESPFITDSGHLILDASFGRIPEPEALSRALHSVPGVVEHGLFLGLASEVILASDTGIKTLQRPAAG